MWGDEFHAATARTLGADGFLTKPFTIEEVSVYFDLGNQEALLWVPPNWGNQEALLWVPPNCAEPGTTSNASCFSLWVPPNRAESSTARNASGFHRRNASVATQTPRMTSWSGRSSWDAPLIMLGIPSILDS